MITKFKRNYTIPKKQRKIPHPRISVAFLSSIFKMENNKPFLGIVKITEDEGVRVPALIDTVNNQYVNLSSGEVSYCSSATTVYPAHVWYMPHNDSFRFIFGDKCLASIAKNDLIIVFGADVIM